MLRPLTPSQMKFSNFHNMKKLLVSIVAVFALAAAASAANYKVNDSAVDALFEEATEVYVADFTPPAAAAVPASAVAPASSVNPGVSLLLNFFLGFFGIHRHYLGTAPWMWALYTFTAGGIFGIVDFVDFVVQIIGVVDGSGIGRYIGNQKFFMWA